MRRGVVFVVAFIVLSLGSLSVAAAGGGCHTPSGTTEGNGLEVKVANCSFSPTIIHAPIGAKVTWFNGDYLPHAINGLGWNATEPYVPAQPGATASYTFGLPGIYPYMCYVHPGMAGVVVVGDVALNPNGDGTTRSDAQAAAAAVAPSSVMPTVEVSIAIALTLMGALAGYAFAVLPRYRWADGATSLRRRDGVHPR